MKILATGAQRLIEELKLKLSSVEHELTEVEYTKLSQTDLTGYDVIFDLNFDDHPFHLKYYAPLKCPVIVSAVKLQLAQAVHVYQGSIACTLIGFNALPGFINRNLAEVSLFQKTDEPALINLMQKLQWDYKLVEDRVGMVTPRVLFMIINEACYTLQEGTAGLKDIDTSMKLGTNYPLGPFEWADLIGIEEVYETLMAVYEDTKAERYKICPLLKSLYLKRGTFY